MERLTTQRSMIRKTSRHVANQIDALFKKKTRDFEGTVSSKAVIKGRRQFFENRE